MNGIPQEMLLTDPLFLEATETYDLALIDLFRENTPTFSNYRSLSEGEVGDCWFLAPLASLSKSTIHRQLLQDNFQIHTDSRTYSIRLYTPGPIDIEITGELWHLKADEKNESDLLFSGQQQNLTEKLDRITNTHIWPCLFEKAAAKMLGGYQALDGGDGPLAKQASDGFRILTEKPVRTILIDEHLSLEDIREELNRGAAVVFTTRLNDEVRPTMKEDTKQDDPSGVNLLHDHAYVVDAITRRSIVTLYNPHGESSKLQHNIAKPLSFQDILTFGLRFDILSVPPAGGSKRNRTVKKKKKKKVSRRHRYSM